MEENTRINADGEWKDMQGLLWTFTICSSYMGILHRLPKGR